MGSGALKTSKKLSTAAQQLLDPRRLAQGADPPEAEGLFLWKPDSQELCQRAAEKLTSGSSLDGTIC